MLNTRLLCLRETSPAHTKLHLSSRYINPHIHPIIGFSNGIHTQYCLTVRRLERFYVTYVDSLGYCRVGIAYFLLELLSASCRSDNVRSM